MVILFDIYILYKIDVTYVTEMYDTYFVVG